LPPVFHDDPHRFQLTSEHAGDYLSLHIFHCPSPRLPAAFSTATAKFAVPAITPVLLNLCMIGGAVFSADLFETPVMALAWAVALAGLLQLLFQLPYLWKLGLLPTAQTQAPS